MTRVCRLFFSRRRRRRRRRGPIRRLACTTTTITTTTITTTTIAAAIAIARTVNSIIIYESSPCGWVEQTFAARAGTERDVVHDSIFVIVNISKLTFSFLSGYEFFHRTR
jgi:hypothetical protein